MIERVIDHRTTQQQTKMLAGQSQATGTGEDDTEGSHRKECRTMNAERRTKNLRIRFRSSFFVLRSAFCILSFLTDDAIRDNRRTAVSSPIPIFHDKLASR